MDSVSDVVTVRPSRLRVGALTAFFLLGLWPVLTPSAPMVVRVVGGATLAAAPLLVVLGLRTKVTISDGAARASVPFAPVALGETARLAAGDGRHVDVPLVLFSARDQALITAASDGSGSTR